MSRPLKIKHNGVLGYFIEVTQQHADKLMTMRDLFRHRQTMAGAVRFSTDELASLASRIGEAGEQSLALEKSLFDEMAALALDNAQALAAIAGALAAIDVSVALGELAVAARHVRPTHGQWSWLSASCAAAIRWWKRRWPRIMRAALCPMIAICRPTPRGACGWSPAPTWRANPPSCARMR